MFPKSMPLHFRDKWFLSYLCRFSLFGAGILLVLGSQSRLGRKGGWFIGLFVVFWLTSPNHYSSLKEIRNSNRAETWGGRS